MGPQGPAGELPELPAAVEDDVWGSDGAGGFKNLGPMGGSEVTLDNTAASGATIIDATGAPDYLVNRIEGSAVVPAFQGTGKIQLGPGAPLDEPGTGTLDNVVTTHVDGRARDTIEFGGGAVTVTGFANNAQGRILKILARTGAVTLKHQTGSSTSNQIVTSTGADVIVPQGAGAIFYGSGLRWYLLGIGALGSGSSLAAPRAESGTGNLDGVVTTSSGTPVYGVEFTGVAPVVRGLASGSARNGAPLHLTATGGPLVLKHQDTGETTAGNRLSLANGEDVRITDEGGCWVVFNSGTSRWHLIGRGDENCKEPAHTHATEHRWVDASGTESPGAALTEVRAKRIVAATTTNTTGQVIWTSDTIPNAASGKEDWYVLDAEIGGSSANTFIGILRISAFIYIDDAGAFTIDQAYVRSLDGSDYTGGEVYVDYATGPNRIQIQVDPPVAENHEWRGVAQLKRMADMIPFAGG